MSDQRNRDGVLNLHKEAGLTSHDAVARVRRILQTRRVGHAGTLDPDATGVLVVAVGQATRLLPYLPLEPKRYVARLVLGTATDTEDAGGQVTETASAAHVTNEQLNAVLPRFVGTIAQVPPMVSAVHHEGRRLYELAREGVTVEREARQVEIFGLTMRDFTGGERAEATLEVACGGGTYIRTLCKDIGVALKLPAHMGTLVRTQVGGYHLADSVMLEQLGNLGNAALLPPVAALQRPTLTINDSDAADVLNGKAFTPTVPPPEVDLDIDIDRVGDGVLLLVHRERLLALARYDSKEMTIKPFRVLPNEQEAATRKAKSAT